MRKLLFVAILATFAVTCLSGCATPGKKWYGYDTKSQKYIKLDNEHFFQPVKNASSYTIFFTVEGKGSWSWTDPYYQINPGFSGSLEIYHSYPNLNFRAYFWCQGCQDVLGTTEEIIQFELPGLATIPTDTLVITDAMLMGDAQQEGRWGNQTGIDLWFKDDRGGNKKLVRDGTTVPHWVTSGYYNIWVRPVATFSDNWPDPGWQKLGKLMSEEPFMIDKKRNIPWVDEKTGQPIYIGWKRIVGTGEIPSWWRDKRHWRQ